MSACKPKIGGLSTERQWGISRILQALYILSVLMLVSSVDATKLNEPSQPAEAALTDTQDEAAADLDVSDSVEHSGDDDTAELTSQDLVSEVELKTIAPHPTGGAAGTTRENAEEAKQRYREQQRKEDEERRKWRSRYDQVVKDVEEAAKAHQAKPKKSSIYSADTSQEREYQKVKADIASLTPEQRQAAVRRYQQEKAEKEKMREKYGNVLEELKKVMEERKRRGSSGMAARTRR